MNPYTHGNAGVNWPSTWGSFDMVSQLARSQGIGIGFVLTEDDPYTCVDLDDCVGEHGQISQETRSILDLLTGWVELSPSGKGLHVWMRNEQPISRRTKGIEIYSRARWISISGRSHPQAMRVIPDRTLEVAELLGRYFLDSAATFEAPAASITDDEEIWQSLFRSRHGDFFRRLYDGDTSVCYDDHSRAVIMLANQLAILTGGDSVRVKRLMYQSGLVSGKWEDMRGRITWIDYQIQDAIAYVSRRKGS